MPVSTVCTGPIGQKYWHQALPPKAQPTVIAAARVSSSHAASQWGSLLPPNKRRQRPAIKRLHCSSTWWRPSQESARTITSSGRWPRTDRVRCQPRDWASWETKASGQRRRQSSWLTPPISSRESGTTVPQNTRLPCNGLAGMNREASKASQPVINNQRRDRAWRSLNAPTIVGAATHQTLTLSPPQGRDIGHSPKNPRARSSAKNLRRTQALTASFHAQDLSSMPRGRANTGRRRPGRPEVSNEGGGEKLGRKINQREKRRSQGLRGYSSLEMPRFGTRRPPAPTWRRRGLQGSWR